MADDQSSTPLPRAVIRMRDNANRRADEFRARQREQAGAPPAQSDTPPAPPAPADGTPPPSPPADPPQDPPPAPRREDTLDYWRGRATSATGIIEATSRQLKEAQRENATLQAQIDELRRTAAPAPAPAAPDILAFYTPEEIERYGEDQCRKLMNVALQAARTEITTQLETRVKPLETRVNQDDQARAREARAAFGAELDRLLPPDWREIDRSPEWLAWLGQVDDRTGETRAVTLDRLNARNDAPRCARIFLEFLATQAPPVASPPPAATPPAAPTPPAARPPVTPPGSGAGGGDGTPPARSERLTPPTQTEIRDFYKRASLGKVTDEERALFERRRALLYPRGTAP
jgi:hypothetical protein